MDNHYNCIYMYINKINGKKYIGKAKDFNNRNSSHIYASKNKNNRAYNYPIHKAIRKYGIENFDIIIIKENLKTQCLLDLYEYYYIKKYNTLDRNNYNASDGGNGGNPYAGKSQEEIDKIRKKISENGKGRKVTDETRKKMSESGKGKHNHNGKNNPRARKVAQYDLDKKLIKIWDCASDVAKYFNVNAVTFHNHLTGRYSNIHKGYIWTYIELPNGEEIQLPDNVDYDDLLKLLDK